MNYKVGLEEKVIKIMSSFYCLWIKYIVGSFERESPENLISISMSLTFSFLLNIRLRFIFGFLTYTNINDET